MSGRERSIRILTPDDQRFFQETGREEVHTVEAYEKKVHGENIEVRSSREIVLLFIPPLASAKPPVLHERVHGTADLRAGRERRDGREDRNEPPRSRAAGESRPPVRKGLQRATPPPAAQLRDHAAAHPAGGDQELRSTPLARARSNGRVSVLFACFGMMSIDQIKHRPARSPPTIRVPRSGRSSGFGSSPQSVDSALQQPIAANVPMRKITRKSRLVSIYDGRPVSPFVERVHFEVDDAGASGLYAPSSHDQWAYKNDGVVLNVRPSNSPGERFIPIHAAQRPNYAAARPAESREWTSRRQEDGRGVIITENPLFYGY
ncbi:hypothetical protein M3Y99_00068200 [Aphelenchoides fujianensis]|nr:hypothetical protein M3Y99_00068200 [Aphelenchoides fujianensis]